MPRLALNDTLIGIDNETIAGGNRSVRYDGYLDASILDISSSNDRVTRHHVAASLVNSANRDNVASLETTNLTGYDLQQSPSKASNIRRPTPPWSVFTNHIRSIHLDQVVFHKPPSATSTTSLAFRGTQGFHG